MITIYQIQDYLKFILDLSLKYTKKIFWEPVLHVIVLLGQILAQIKLSRRFNHWPCFIMVLFLFILKIAHFTMNKTVLHFYFHFKQVPMPTLSTAILHKFKKKLWLMVLLKQLSLCMRTLSVTRKVIFFYNFRVFCGDRFFIIINLILWEKKKKKIPSKYFIFPAIIGTQNKSLDSPVGDSTSARQKRLVTKTVFTQAMKQQSIWTAWPGVQQQQFMKPVSIFLNFGCEKNFENGVESYVVWDIEAIVHGLEAPCGLQSCQSGVFYRFWLFFTGMWHNWCT